MSELIGIREAARRLGVSDTAVRKAIAAGRVTVAGKHENNGRPLLSWPAARDQWLANSDSSKRSHVGATGTSARRQKYASKPGEVELPTSGTGGESSAQVQRMSAARDDDEQQAPAAKSGGPSYAQSRAVREAYAARLAKLEYEERSGKLVSVDALKVEAFKAHRRVRDALLNIPDRCAPQIAAMETESEVHAFLLTEINAALRQLAADIYAPQK